jgi:Zn-dependent peptidase ImmA (M78 family)
MTQVSAVAVAPRSARIRLRSKLEIEDEADRLLASFAGKRGGLITPPIPVEEILEFHLGYDLDFDDPQRRMGSDMVLGALDVAHRGVVVDEYLVNSPKQEARLRYTVAHECGHIVLHATQLVTAGEAGTREGDFICWDRKVRASLEREANYFASCLLIPRGMFFEAWDRCQNFMSSMRVDSTRVLLRERLAEQVLLHMTNTFQVSRIAMLIRFLELELYRRDEVGRILAARA